MQLTTDLAPYVGHRTVLAVGVFFMSILIAGSAPGADHPNVILIMADDLGAEALGCYGSTLYSTPHLDRMAAEGMRFNNAYATPLCTPTRVMIMSGLYPNRTGTQALMGKSDDQRLDPSIVTFCNDFQNAGYKTAIAGKWQLGKFDEYPQQVTNYGFDEYCMWAWFYGGKKTSRYYAPSIFINGKHFEGKKEQYGPDIYRDFVLEFIDTNKVEPFFIYYPMALPHTPFDQPPRLAELAETKFPATINKNTRKFGHLVTYMDDIVGTILQRLKDHGLAENTIVLFTADNGTHKSVTSILPGLEVQGGKGSLTEAGSRVPLIAWWPETIEPQVTEKIFSLADILPTTTALAGISVERQVDGKNLSHYLLGTEGIDRDHAFVTWKTGAFVREHRFRLKSERSRSAGLETLLYDIPMSSNVERYGEKVADAPRFADERQRLEPILENYMAIEKEYHLKD